MIRVLPLSLLALSACVAGPATRERALSVRHVMENAEALDGQEILVRGWIEECQHLSCTLWASPQEARRGWPDYRLSIGSSRWFDAFARRNAPLHITLRAKFDARCVTDPASGIIAACADRSNSLKPLSVVR